MKVAENETKLVNFRLNAEDYEDLRILAELTSSTQTAIIRVLIKDELEKQRDAIEDYKRVMEKLKGKIKK